MNSKHEWPSIKLSVIVGILLAAGAAVSVFWQPMNPRARAEKLYLDSWFVTSNGIAPIISSDRDPSDGAEQAIRMLEKALEIWPGNSLYEQALVWRYPADDLPDLLEKRRLGHKARILAFGLICEHKMNEWSPNTAQNKTSESPDLPSTPPLPNKGSTLPNPLMPLSGPIGTQVSTEEIAFKLKCLDELSKQDPTNALPRYRKAYILINAGRVQESIQELKIASRLDGIRYYFPQVPKQVLDSRESPMVLADLLHSGAEYRSLARVCVSRANELLRQGQVKEALDILEACCRMSVHVSSAEPKLVISVLVGKSIFNIAGSELEAVYKDFEMADQVAAFKKTDQVYREADKLVQAFINKMDFSMTGSVLRPILLPAFLSTSAAIVFIVIVIMAIGLGLAVIIMRRRGLPPISIRPWHYSQPMRLVIILYMCGLCVLLVGWFGSSRFGAGLGSVYLPLQIVILPPVLLQLVLSTLIIKALRQTYGVETGERVSFLRFAFRMPVNVAAWGMKCSLAALGMQLLILSYLSLATVVVYKPVFGAHPWQFSRLPVCLFSQEADTVSEIAAKLDASMRQWPGK